MQRSAVISRLQASEFRIQAIGKLQLSARPRICAAFAVVLMLSLAGCGGGSSSTTAIPNTLTAAPSFISLNFGNVAAISATVTDSKGVLVTNPPTFTYSSSNTAVATVSSAGSVCAGKWDALFIVCDTTGVR